ncbi:MAG: polysaccharide biosynthesis tyrosine autokinase [Verrucomicrobiota bacterium]
MIPGLKKRTFTFHDLVMYLALAYVHIRLVALVFCFCMLCGTAYYVYAKPVYYARALVRVDYLALPVDSDQNFHDSSMWIIITQLSSQKMIESTAARLGIKGDYKKIVTKYLKRVSIKTSSPNSLDVEVWAYSTNLSRRWAEAMILEFVKAREQQRLYYNEMLIKAFKNEISELGEKIESSFGQKFDFQTNKGMTEAMIELNRIRELPNEIVRLKRRIEIVERVKKKLEDPELTTIARLSLIAGMEKDIEAEMQLSVGDMVTPMNASEGNQANKDKPQSPSFVVLPSLMSANAEQPWQKLERDQRRINGEIAEASAIYMPGHQKMVALNKELEEVGKNLALEYQVGKARFDIQYQDLLNKQADLDAKMPSYQEITKKYEKIKQDYQLHESGQLAWDRMYAEASKRISAVEFGGEKERANLQYLGLTDAKDNPVSPMKMKVFAIAAVAGILLGLGLAFLIEFLDHTISNIEEIEATFQIRGLGIIPQVEEAEAQHPILMDIQGATEKNILENFRVIRTNLLSMGSMSKPPHVMMVTSSIPKEGKTVVSSNLAISFAQMGAKTLLIDTDLRRGRLHRLFGLRKSPGLSNLLLEKSTLEETLRPTGKENLTVLTAGAHLESGTELLGSQKFADIMKELRGRYDRILIDTPPVLGLSETSILQGQVDGVLFVVWGGRTPIRSMKTAVEMLQANGANLYGFILNRLDLSATTNYYQYYYYSNDYYHNYHALENA